jgi:hypothetical protein
MGKKSQEPQAQLRRMGHPEADADAEETSRTPSAVTAHGAPEGGRRVKNPKRRYGAWGTRGRKKSQEPKRRYGAWGTQRLMLKRRQEPQARRRRMGHPEADAEAEETSRTPSAITAHGAPRG